MENLDISYKSTQTHVDVDTQMLNYHYSQLTHKQIDKEEFPIESGALAGIRTRITGFGNRCSIH